MFRAIKSIIHRNIKPAWIYFLQKKISPLSPTGQERGTPIDSYYIEAFFSDNKEFIHGKCMEVRDDYYTKKFGENIFQCDIFDMDKTNTKATIHGDLRSSHCIPDSTYDCIMLPHILHLIDDPDRVISEMRRIVKPGGAILATVPSIPRIDPRAGEWGDFWRFTRAGAWHLFQKYFKRTSIDVSSKGNCLTGLGYWIGQSVHEIPKEKIDQDDELFPVIITIKAIKE